ncbi:IS66 family insertion sequence element accessory protein TnpB [Bradyrhizobium liaoningense]
MDGLVALVRDAGSDPFDGSLYVFRAKRADRIKIVWWDGSGVCLYLKRLEKARFCWPRIGHHRVQLNAAQLMLEAGPDRGGQAAHRRVAE